MTVAGLAICLALVIAAFWAGRSLGRVEGVTAAAIADSLLAEDEEPHVLAQRLVAKQGRQ